MLTKQQTKEGTYDQISLNCTLFAEKTTNRVIQWYVLMVDAVFSSTFPSHNLIEYKAVGCFMMSHLWQLKSYQLVLLFWLTAFQMQGSYSFN